MPNCCCCFFFSSIKSINRITNGQRKPGPSSFKLHLKYVKLGEWVIVDHFKIDGTIYVIKNYIET